MTVIRERASRFVTECRATIDSVFDLSSANQSTINAVFRILCKPECGNVLLDSYDACGDFDAERRVIVGLCAFNRNGQFCYEIHSDNTALYASALSCSSSPGDCNCIELSEGIRWQGCCINVIHDLVNSLGGIDPLEDVYDDCNIALPRRGCTNSLLRDSSHLPEEPDNFLELQQCILDKFDMFYQGNDADYVTECRSIIDSVGASNIVFTDQLSINTVYSTLCTPGCGDVVLDAYHACGVFDSEEQKTGAAVHFCGNR